MKHQDPLDGLRGEGLLQELRLPFHVFHNSQADWSYGALHLAQRQHVVRPVEQEVDLEAAGSRRGAQSRGRRRIDAGEAKDLGQPAGVSQAQLLEGSARQAWNRPVCASLAKRSDWIPRRIFFRFGRMKAK